MKQKQYSPQSIAEMSLLVYAADNNFLQDVSVDKIGDYEDALLSYVHAEHAELLNTIVESGDWNSDIESSFKSLLETFAKTQTF